MNTQLTFDHLADSISKHPDCSVDITDILVGSTHTFVDSQRQIIRAKISKEVNLKNDHEAHRSKKWLSEVLQEIEAGRTKAAKNDNFNLR